MWNYDIATRKISWLHLGTDVIDTNHLIRPTDLDSYVSLVHPEDQEKMIERISGVSSDGSRTLELEHRVRQPDGKYCYIRAVGERYNQFGRHIIVGIGQEIELRFRINIVD